MIVLHQITFTKDLFFALLLIKIKACYKINKAGRDQNQKYVKIGAKLKSSIKKGNSNPSTKRSVTINFKKQQDEPKDNIHNNEELNVEPQYVEIKTEDKSVRPSTTISLNRNSNFKNKFIKLRKNSFSQTIQSQADFKHWMNYEENKGWRLFVSWISK